MLARGKCLECGTSFQTDSEVNLDKLMTAHIASQHGSLEQTHGKVLGDSLSAFFVIANGGKITPAVARSLHNRIADLLAKPHLAVEVPAAPAPVAPAPDVPQASSPTLVPAPAAAPAVPVAPALSDPGKALLFLKSEGWNMETTDQAMEFYASMPENQRPLFLEELERWKPEPKPEEKEQ